MCNFRIFRGLEHFKSGNLYFILFLKTVIQKETDEQTFTHEETYERASFFCLTFTKFYYVEIIQTLKRTGSNWKLTQMVDVPGFLNIGS